MKRDLQMRVEPAPRSATGCSRAMQQGLGILADWSFAQDTPLNREKVLPIVCDDEVSLATEFGRGTVAVATHNLRQDIGMRTLFVDRFVVRHDLRGQGIGSVLLEHVLGRAAELECDTTELYAINDEAINFYSKRGFETEDHGYGEMSRMVYTTPRFTPTDIQTS